MRILMLSWEYPPGNIGGLGQHVADLTQALVRLGVEVHVVCPATDNAPDFEKRQGVYVYRVQPYPLSTPDYVSWVLQLNIALLEKSVELLNSVRRFELIHAHDWLVAHASRALKHSYQLPLVATVHATEHGRNHGLHNDVQRFIGSVDWWLTYEAWRVICCSYYMQEELQRVLQLPGDKIQLIRNGVNRQDFQVDEALKDELPAFRSRYAHPDEKIIFYVGRLVHEKGVQLLLDAAPRILAAYPKCKFVIAGQGPNENYLKQKTWEMGTQSQFYFTGYIDDSTRNCLYQCADVAVFPSLYEPFGIVALEAMAAGAPVIVPDTGGISELINSGFDGLKFNTGSVESLAHQIIQLLGQPQLMEQFRQQAYKKVVNLFSWDHIASQTITLYKQVLKEKAENERRSLWSADWLAGRLGDRLAERLADKGGAEVEGNHHGWWRRHKVAAANLRTPETYGAGDESASDGTHH